MAYTLTRVDTDVFGSNKARTVDMDISSYTTGGESFAPSDVGMNRFITVLPVNTAADGYVPQWDQANDKIKVLIGDNDNAADGPLTEAAAAANPGNIRLLCIGK